MTIYISGGIRGVENHVEKFMFAEHYLRRRYPGAVILNPVSFWYPPEWRDGKHEREIMAVCYAYLKSADTLFLLRGWETSTGSRKEWRQFRADGKTEIVYER